MSQSPHIRAVLLMIGFHCFVWPGELVNLTLQDLHVLPAYERSENSPSAVVVDRKPKVQQYGSSGQQLVTVEEPTTAELMTWVLQVRLLLMSTSRIHRIPITGLFGAHLRRSRPDRIQVALPIPSPRRAPDWASSTRLKLNTRGNLAILPSKSDSPERSPRFFPDRSQIAFPDMPQTRQTVPV